MAPARRRLSVVVVTHLGGDWLRRSLASLQGQITGVDELIVVVSADPGQADLDALPPCILIELGHNPHYAAAANAGLARAGGEWLLVLNDDTCAAPDFVAELMAAATSPGMYQPRILLADGSGRLDNAGHGLLPDGFNWAIGREDAEQDYEEAGTVGSCSGAAFLVHRAVLDRVGTFNEDLVAYGEDVDLSLRARRAGFSLRYVPSARIEHALGASQGRFSSQKIFWVERNRVRVALRSMPRGALLFWPAFSGARIGLLMLARVQGKGWSAEAPSSAFPAAVKGILAGLGAAPDALRKRRADREHWSASEAKMWQHIWQHRVRWRDLSR